MELPFKKKSKPEVESPQSPSFKFPSKTWHAIGLAPLGVAKACAWLLDIDPNGNVTHKRLSKDVSEFSKVSWLNITQFAHNVYDRKRDEWPVEKPSAMIECVGLCPLTDKTWQAVFLKVQNGELLEHQFLDVPSESKMIAWERVQIELRNKIYWKLKAGTWDREFAEIAAAERAQRDAEDRARLETEVHAAELEAQSKARALEKLQAELKLPKLDQLQADAEAAALTLQAKRNALAAVGKG